LAHRIAHRAGHRIAHRKPGAETDASARATTRILRRIAHRVRSLKLRVTSHIANHAHRSALVHRGFDFLRQRDVFDDELRQLKSERLELFIKLDARELPELVVIRREIERGNLRLPERITKAAN
jgi:hypothetical protein